MDFGIRRIIINTAAGTWAKIGSAIVSLLTTPILFNYLGPERFGLFAILGSLGAYAGLFDWVELRRIIWVLPLVPLGVWTGRWLAYRINRQTFENIIVILLFINGVLLIIL